MDRNTITGFSLIFLILAGYYWYTAPSPEEKARMQQTRDSIAQVNQRMEDSLAKFSSKASSNVSTDSNKNLGSNADVNDDSKEVKSTDFTGSKTEQTDTQYTLTSKELTLRINNKGGTLSSVKLNSYVRSDKSDLELLSEGKNQMLWTWTDHRGVELNSADFFWEITEQTSNRLYLRLSIDSQSYIEQRYALDDKRPFVVDYDFEIVGMTQFVRRGNSDFKLDWKSILQKQERDMKWEEQHSSIVYKLPNETPTTLTTTDQAEELVKSPIQWFAFKQQYFTAVLSSKEDISSDAKFTMKAFKRLAKDSSLDVKEMSARLFVNYKGEEKRKANFNFYFGPTHYKTLEKTQLNVENAELERLIPLGWGIFGWVNRGVVIPVFSALDGVIGSMGILIMLLTFIIKTLLLPLVYKSYISTAKMRILKPEIDAIKEKHGNDMTKTQQENMALYKKAGVSPLSGCVPMLLQLPILFAMFQFFPVAFELRQKSFLWAADLSQYDGPALGFNIPFYGDHVSFFTLMMTLSTLIYTHLNNQISGVTGQMKYIGYFMPVIFLGVLNDYASGLTWYYFVSNMVTFGQQYIIRKTVDDEKLRSQIAAARKKPVKKSKFQERMELAMKASQNKSRGK